MTGERQVMMLVPCERHTDTVVGILDQAQVIDWAILPAARARRIGALEYRPAFHESSCNVVLGVADALPVTGALHTVAQAVQEKGLCPHCLVYVWEATQTLLTSVALDPVCRTVDQEEALSATHEGRVYYFCSRDCRAQFLRGPTLTSERETPPRGRHPEEPSADYRSMLACRVQFTSAATEHAGKC